MYYNSTIMNHLPNPFSRGGTAPEKANLPRVNEHDWDLVVLDYSDEKRRANTMATMRRIVRKTGMIVTCSLAGTLMGLGATHGVEMIGKRTEPGFYQEDDGDGPFVIPSRLTTVDTLPRCYEDVLPADDTGGRFSGKLTIPAVFQRAETASATVGPLSPIALKMHEGTLAPVKSDRDALKSKFIDSVVGVFTDSGWGTGFAVANPYRHGEITVVTAAHVVGGADKKTINIMKKDGTIVPIASGCIISDGKEKSGNTAAVNPDTRRDEDMQADVAVLRLMDTSDLNPVPLAPRSAERGEQVIYIDYPGRPVPVMGVPSIFSGVTIRNESDRKTFDVMAGLEEDRPNAPLDTVNHGASGGPVLDMQGRVVGVSVTGYSLDTGELGKDYAVDVSSLDVGKTTAMRSGTTRVELVDLALASLNY